MVTPSITAVSKGAPPRNNIVFQPLDTHQTLPANRPYYPSITNISTEHPSGPDEQEKVFVETFLIDAVSKPNSKGWKVSYDNPADFDRRVLESKNHPLVLFQTQGSKGELIFDHPVAPITTLEAAADPVRANIEFQKKFTIGHAKHFKKIKDGIWNATYEITNKNAKKFFINAKNKGIKLFTSPYIVRPSNEPDRTNIHEWALIHNAIVTTPAHNEAVASIKEVCTKTSDNPYGCQSLFASLTVADDDAPTEDCGYCMERALEQYTAIITSHDNINDNLFNMAESASSNNNTANNNTTTTTQPLQQSTVTTDNPLTGQTTVEVKPQSNILTETKPNIPQQEAQQQQSQQQVQQVSELEALKKELESMKQSNQELQQKYAYDTRKASIEKIFSPIVNQVYLDQVSNTINEKAYQADVKKYTDKNLDLDDIQEIVQAKFILAQWNAAKQQSGTKPERASITSQSDETDNTTYTQMNAVGSNSKSSSNSISLGLEVAKKLAGAFY